MTTVDECFVLQETMLRSPAVVLLLPLLLLLGGAWGAREMRVYPSGLTIIVTKRAVNCTMAAQNGDTLLVHYTVHTCHRT